MSQMLQKVVIAYAFFVLGMMGGFAYLNGFDFALNSLFSGGSYLAFFFSALIALLFLGFVSAPKKV